MLAHGLTDNARAWKGLQGVAVSVTNAWIVSTGSPVAITQKEKSMKTIFAAMLLVAGIGTASAQMPAAVWKEPASGAIT